VGGTEGGRGRVGKIGELLAKVHIDDVQNANIHTTGFAYRICTNTSALLKSKYTLNQMRALRAKASPYVCHAPILTCQSPPRYHRSVTRHSDFHLSYAEKHARPVDLPIPQTINI
jgi:hypothetical protein